MCIIRRTHYVCYIGLSSVYLRFDLWLLLIYVWKKYTVLLQ